MFGSRQEVVIYLAGFLDVRCKNLNQNHGPAATTEREGLGENQVSDSLDCTDGKGAEVAEMTTRLS